jgi:hypothetical protein
MSSRFASGADVAKVLNFLVFQSVFERAIYTFMHAIINKTLVFYKSIIFEYTNLISEFLM